MDDRSRGIIDANINEIIDVFVAPLPLITFPCVPLNRSVREYDRIVETDETTDY